MKVTAIIPARLTSERLADKVLLDIAGKPMIMHVYDNLIHSDDLNEVFIATDSDRIITELKTFNPNIIKTGICQSGTERVIRASDQSKGFDILINVQGDEPLINSEHIRAIISVFESEPEAQIATLVERFDSESDLRDPNNVKVVLSEKRKALYFSRSVIPYSPKLEGFHYKHVGVYAFRREILNTILELEFSELRKQERLEQLDWLVAEIPIYAKEVSGHLIGVDTELDLKAVREIISKANNQH